MTFFSTFFKTLILFLMTRLWIRHQNQAPISIASHNLPCVVAGDDPVVDDLIAAFHARTGSINSELALHLPLNVTRSDSNIPSNAFASDDDTALDVGCPLSFLGKLGQTSANPFIIKSRNEAAQGI